MLRCRSTDIKPHFEGGNALFDLHCPKCRNIIAADEMAGAAIQLLGRLKANELAFLGIAVTEAVSDTEEGKAAYCINEPLA